MNLYAKKHITYKAKKNMLSFLAIATAFTIVYCTFLFGAERIAEKGKGKILPSSSQSIVMSIKNDAASPDSKLPIDAAFERKVPLYLSDLPEDTADIQKIAGFETVSVYFHETGKTEKLPLEEYVLGVLLAEMPTSYGEEALKAQAVACRTYAVYKALNTKGHEGAGQLCTSSAHCQAYADLSKISDERLKIAKKAVDDTKGIIMLYKGEPILSVFHAASVGKTRSSAEVWGGELPYLVPVKTSEDAFMSVTERRGHGVGMSQYGAQCLASEGYDFYAILSHYYTGVEFGNVL